MKLNKKDWSLLDELLAKIGFGGYYDCIEVLRMTALALCKYRVLPFEKCAKIQQNIRKEDDLQALILVIYRLAKEVIR